MTKCPYVPPHPWNIDFPHLMLRAKAVKHRKGEYKLRDKILASTDAVGTLAGIPVVVQAVNAANKNKTVRKIMDKMMGVHPDAILPEFHGDTLRKRAGKRRALEMIPAPTEQTRGKVALFGTCYGNRNEPQIGMDLITVFEHNGIPVTLAQKEQCCGMPKLELGDLEAVERAKEANIPALARLVDEGWDIVAPVPSCVLMFKQELPLMFPDDADVRAVSEAFWDPFEYFVSRHRDGLLKTDFKTALGKVSYHVPCHARVQNIGRKTSETLALVPDTQVTVVERCSGHAGLFGIKKEFHRTAMQIGTPVFKAMAQPHPDYISSDCQLAGHHIEQGFDESGLSKGQLAHPLTLLRKAYGL